MLRAHCFEDQPRGRRCCCCWPGGAGALTSACHLRYSIALILEHLNHNTADMTVAAQLHARRASTVLRDDSAGEIISVFQTHDHHGGLESAVHDSCLDMMGRTSVNQLRKRSHGQPSGGNLSRIELSVALSGPRSSAMQIEKHDGPLGTASATLQLTSASTSNQEVTTQDDQQLHHHSQCLAQPCSRCHRHWHPWAGWAAL